MDMSFLQTVKNWKELVYVFYEQPLNLRGACPQSLKDWFEVVISLVLGIEISAAYPTSCSCFLKAY